MRSRETILITGASGFLGQHLIPSLEQHYKIISLGRTQVEGLENINVDFTSETLRGLPKVDYVIHAAGKAHIVPKTKKDKEQFFQINLEGTRRLLAALSHNQPKSFIYISSIAVYGQDSGRDIDENFPLLASDPYGLSKLEAEKEVLKWGENNGVCIGILRLPLLIGKNAPGNFGAMVKAIKKGHYFNIGNGDSKKSMLLASDIAEILPVLFKKRGVYNLTDGCHPSFKELSGSIASALGKNKVLSIPLPLAKFVGMSGDILKNRMKVDFPFNSYSFKKMTTSLTFDDSRARKELNWNPNRVLDRISECL